MRIPVPGLQLDYQPDEVIWRMLVWAEARGEPLKGQLAVLYAPFNRAIRSGKTMKDEILKPLQFSAFNEDDPNRGRLMTAYKDDPIGWARADAVCGLFEQHCTKDPTDGATHYYVLGQVNPSWGRGHPTWQDRGMIGRHCFGVQT
jgi:spore germination cell wall hydrolase CwlJ-like protein